MSLSVVIHLSLRGGLVFPYLCMLLMILASHSISFRLDKICIAVEEIYPLFHGHKLNNVWMEQLHISEEFPRLGNIFALSCP